MKVNIRYNPMSNGRSSCWWAIIDDKAELFDSIKIFVPSSTSCNHPENQHHMTCDANEIIREGRNLILK